MKIGKAWISVVHVTTTYLTPSYNGGIALHKRMGPAPKSVVVSFDIGKVNMSYCIVEVDNTSSHRPLTIKDWNNTNLSANLEKPTLEIVSSKCVAWLKSIFTTNKIKDSNNTWVLVERQRPINPDAFGLAYTVFTFFMSRYHEANVCFVSAKSKPIAQAGKKRKRASVKATKGILDDLPENALNLRWITWFQQQKKRDDLADSFLQIVGNIRGIAVYEQDENKVEHVIVIDDSEDDSSVPKLPLVEEEGAEWDNEESLSDDSQEA